MLRFWRVVQWLAVIWAGLGTLGVIMFAPQLSAETARIMNNIADDLAAKGYSASGAEYRITDRQVAENTRIMTISGGGFFVGSGTLVLAVSSIFINRIKRAIREEERHQELLAILRSIAGAPASRMDRLREVQTEDATQSLAAAREHIKAKRYADARAILNTIDTPTAQEWLKKVDALEAKAAMG